MSKATFTFYGALNYFLPRRQKHQTIEYEFDWKASIKDMLEAIAPPHPEVALLVVNGQSVNWEYIVQDGDDIHAYPNLDAVDLENKVQLIPPYQGRPKFILDTHLGRLASYLRMMGFDTLYKNDYADDVLAEVSAAENRILLTRDIGVLKRGIVTYGYFVRETNPVKRMHEINQRYHLTEQLQPFKHCMKCNGLLKAVSKDELANKVPTDTLEIFETFHQCQHCKQVYWKGSHYKKMAALIDNLIQSTGN